MTTTFEVPGVRCEHCRDSIEGALSPVAGVRQVDVDLGAKTVTIVHEESVPVEDLAELIEAQGYDLVGPRG